MTQTADGAEPFHDVVIVGAGAAAACSRAALTEAGITGFMLEEEVVSSVFDDDTDTWLLKTRGGGISRGRVVIATNPPLFVPWIPNNLAQNDFRGVAFHTAAWQRDFDPAGKRVAVVGADSSAGRSIDQLVALAASVKVFAYPPRRFVPVLHGPLARRRRWLRRHAWPVRQARSHRQSELMRAPIESVTTRGIRACDGAHHDLDAIIYGTGLAIAEEASDDTLVGARGVTIRRAWQDGMEPYLGVAVHGFPNYFLITPADDEAQVRYITRCVTWMTRKAGTRIEVRHSTQQVFNERVHLRRPTQRRVASAFDLSSNATVEDEIYDGPAMLSIADAHLPVRVRLTGYLEPVDGQYHWQGMLFDMPRAELLNQTRAVTLSVGDCSSPARVTEETPQGTHTIVGVGPPPFAVTGAEPTAP